MALNPYSKIGWQNSPSQATPINATNLNKMDDQLYDVSDHLINLNANGLYYDNSGSGMTAQNVQDAVDEIYAPAFTQAGSRVNISTGETLPTLFGKIKKFFADLKTVAFSGAYNDLSGKPTIGNGTLTIKKDGVNVATFTANQTGNATANITVSDLISTVTVPFTQAVQANNYTYVSIIPTIPAGYSVIGATVFLSDTQTWVFGNLFDNPDGNDYLILLRNINTGTAITVKGNVVFILKKN